MRALKQLHNLLGCLSVRLRQKLQDLSEAVHGQLARFRLPCLGLRCENESVSLNL